MAVWMGGAIVQQARGSVTGVTYSTIKGRNVCKQKAVPVRRVRGAQPAIRSAWGYITRAWAGLTNLQRQAWTDYAATHPLLDKFGNPGLVSGFNMFVKLNQLKIRAYGSTVGILTLPPVTEPIASIESIAASDGVADGAVVITPVFLGTGLAADKWQLQIAGPFASEGRTSVESYFTDQTSTDGDDATVTVTDLMIDAWYYFRARYLELNNVPSNWVYAQWQAPDVA